MGKGRADANSYRYFGAGGTGCADHDDCDTCPFADCLLDKPEKERARLIETRSTSRGGASGL